MSMRISLRTSTLALGLAGFAFSAVACCASKPPEPAPGPQRTAHSPVPATRPATNPTAAAPAWRDLFDGKSLKNWKASGFAAEGEPVVEDGLLILPTGETLTGVTYANEDNLPTVNYEVEVVAKKTDGSDFFCGLTFPVKDNYATLVVGGWGGAVVGISNIDDVDAAHNDTTTYERFEKDKWYTIRMRVLPEKLQAWIDDKQVVDVSIKGKKVDLRVGIEEARPLGVSSFQTTSAIKSIRIRKLAEDEKG